MLHERVGFTTIEMCFIIPPFRMSERPICPETVKTVGEVTAARACADHAYGEAYEAARFTLSLLIAARPVAPVVYEIPLAYGFILYGERHRCAKEFSH